ncbi:MAG: SPFH domain-containing protein [bacterium]
MQLGEVFEQAQAAAAPAAPRRPRRWRRWLYITASLALAGALWRHGPGIALPEPGDLLVLTNDVGIDLFGPPVEVVVGGDTPIFYVPVARHAFLISQRPRVPEPVRLTALSAEGIPVALVDTAVTYRVDRDQAAAVFTRLGADPAGWDAHARAALAGAWSDAIAGRGAGWLAHETPVSLLPTVQESLRTRLNPLTLMEIRPPTWTLAPELRAALDAVAEADAAEAADEKVAREADAALALRRQAAEQQQGLALGAARAEGRAAIEAARTRAAERLAQARQEIATLGAAAEVVRDGLMRKAEAITARAPSRPRP